MPNIIINRRSGRAIKAMPYGNVWSAQVQANGGAKPSLNSINTVDTFMAGLASHSLTSSIITVNLFAPDSLIAAITPQIAATTQPWTNTGFVLADLSVNGLHPVGGQYLDPGVIPNASALTTTSMSLFFYDYLSNTNVAGTEFGIVDSGADSAFCSNFGAGGLNTFSDLSGSGCRLNLVTPGNGFFLASRISSSDNQIYFANSGTAFASVASNALASGPLLTIGYLVFATNSNGSPIQGAQVVSSCAGVAKGLTSTQGQALFNLVQAARVSFGGGYR